MDYALRFISFIFFQVSYDSDAEESSYSFLNREDEEEDTTNRVQWLVENANNDATKMISRRTEKLSSLVDESFETVFVGIKYDVLEPLPQTKKVDCFQKLRKIFDGGKAAVRKHVMKEANKLCNEIDDVL